MGKQPKDDERILTQHPEGKSGVNIERKKYDQMRAAILELLSEHSEIGFSEAMAEINQRLKGKFDGKISWYFTNVKLDLEARGELIRLPGTGKQKMRKA
jgi:hypothetical protein